MPESEIFHTFLEQSLGYRPSHSIPFLGFEQCKNLPVAHSPVGIMRMGQMRDSSDTKIPTWRDFDQEP